MAPVLSTLQTQSINKIQPECRGTKAVVGPQLVGRDPLGEVKWPFTGVTWKTDVHIMIHNSSKITDAK